MPNSPVQIETKTGGPFRVGDAQVAVRSQAVQVNLPRLHGGLVWNRPVSVSVQTPDGREQTVPVRDITRMAQMLILGWGLLASLLIWAATRRGR